MIVPKSEEEIIQKEQQYDLSYAQIGYLYTILHDAPHFFSCDLSTPRASLDLVGMVTHMVGLVLLTFK
jgi:hypothetical protein